MTLFRLTEGTARADDGACLVRLFPPGADDAWRTAAMRLDERARGLPAGSTDCREMDVDVVEGHASLTFVTRDGRRAVREVATPDELVPVAETLLVTLPPPAAAASPPAPLPPSPPSPAPSPPPTPLREPPEDKGPFFVVGAGGGARIGVPGAFVSPTLLLSGGLVFARWELELRGQWDPAHAAFVTALPAGFRFATLSGGLQAGRREPLGVMEISFGGIFAVSHASWTVPDTGGNAQGEVSGSNGSGSTTGSVTEPRLGLYVGLSVPRRSWLRFHPEITSDMAVGHLGRGLAIDQDITGPFWGTALTLGAEAEIP